MGGEGVKSGISKIENSRRMRKSYSRKSHDRSAIQAINLYAIEFFVFRFSGSFYLSRVVNLYLIYLFYQFWCSILRFQLFIECNWNGLAFGPGEAIREEWLCENREMPNEKKGKKKLFSGDFGDFKSSISKITESIRGKWRTTEIQVQ